MKVLVREGDTLLECECPVKKCDLCKLRFKCWTSRPLTGLTLAEKMTFLTGQNGDELPRPVVVKDYTEQWDESIHYR